MLEQQRLLQLGKLSLVRQVAPVANVLHVYCDLAAALCEFQRIRKQIQQNLLQPPLVCANFKVVILRTKISLRHQVDGIHVLSVHLSQREVVKVHDNIDSVELRLLALDQDYFFDRVFYIESLRVLPKLVLPDLRKIQDVVDEKVEDFLAGHLDLDAFFILL